MLIAAPPRYAAFLVLIALALVLVAGGPSSAAYLRNVPQKITQPDGAVIECLASGDEHFNWLHDSDGFVIIQDPDTGYYVYAVLVNGDLAPSKYVVGRTDPRAVGLTPGVMPSPDVLRARFAASREALQAPSIVNAPTSGAIANIVVFIRFSDEAEFTNTIASYDSMFNNATVGANSMYNYFKETSYNALSVTSTFYPTPTSSTVISYQDSQPRGYYQPYNATTNPIGYQGGDTGSERTTREHTLLKNAVNAIAAQVSTGLTVDGDHDGNVDNVCFIISGSAGGWNSLLWPHQWALYTQYAYINNKRVYTYDLQLQNYLGTTNVGVLCHEMMHSLGAPDLYHYSYDGLSPVGGWDLMENNANPPQYTGAYMKYRYTHWISSLPTITAPGVYTLNSLASATGNCYKIASPNSTTEYYVVEYRRKTGAFESSVPSSGLLVYRINSARDGQGNSSGPPDEVYIYRPGGTTTVNGTISTASFSSDYSRTVINDSTNPSPFLSTGAAGGLNISEVSTCGDTISFRVNMQIKPVTFSLESGILSKSRVVSLNCATSGVRIYYTTNGDDPDTDDASVSPGGTVLVNRSMVLKARACKTDWIPSDIKSAVYVIGSMTVPQMKSESDGAPAGTSSALVTAAFTDSFYVVQSQDDRACGLRVDKSSHGLSAGMLVSTLGAMRTGANGERYLEAVSGAQVGSDSPKPVGMQCRSIGGGDWLYDAATGAGQQGIDGGVGLNNIGALVRVAGITTLDTSGSIASWDMDTDPGWALEGQWAWGQPTGGGSHNYDPTSGYTGANVMGYNLAGDYANSMASTDYATTPAIDCSRYNSVLLRFRRWLAVESSSWDHANIQASKDGVNWSDVWVHSGSSLSEAAWSLQEYDISSIADGQSSVLLRWGMGVTDSSVSYPGWNIDDVEVLGASSAACVNDGSGAGIDVIIPAGVVWPSDGSCIAVTGVVSCRKDGNGNLHPVIRPRDASDIQVW